MPGYGPIASYPIMGPDDLDAEVVVVGVLDVSAQPATWNGVGGVSWVGYASSRAPDVARPAAVTGWLSLRARPADIDLEAMASSFVDGEIRLRAIPALFRAASTTDDDAIALGVLGLPDGDDEALAQWLLDSEEAG